MSDSVEKVERQMIHLECDQEISRLRLNCRRVLDAVIDLRDSVLYERGPLAEAGLSSDQVNAVLGVIDDAFSGLFAILPFLHRPLGSEEREPTKEQWTAYERWLNSGSPERRGIEK